MNLYLWLFLISIVCFGLQFEPLAGWSAWQLSGIQHGQWWRILTGNFTHTNFAHLGMNLAGLWIISFIFKPAARTLLILLLSLSVWIGLCVLLTDMRINVGLSGTLHALFAFFALQEAQLGRRSSWLLVLGVVAKVVWEQAFGSSMGTEQLIHARVATEAHLAGVIGGGLLALTLKLCGCNRLISQ